MSSLIQLSIISPHETVVYQVTWVNLPGLKGRRGILPDMAPEIILLQSGEMTFATTQETKKDQSVTLDAGIGHIYPREGVTHCDVVTSL